MATESTPLKKYVMERADRIASWVAKPAHTMTIDDFHSLRVDIKQIRTLLKFVHVLNPDFPYTKTFSPFRQLFRQAGKIRELQLLLQSLRDQDDMVIKEPYTREVYREVEKAMVAFLLVLTTAWEKDIRKAVKKIKPCLKRIRTGKAERKLTKMKNAIRKHLLSGHLKKTEVHAIRKEIKKLYYLEKAFGIENPHSKTADDFQERLGLWHDHWVIGDHLTRDIHHRAPDDPVSRQLDSLRKKIKLREQFLFDTILHERKAYLQAIA